MQILDDVRNRPWPVPREPWVLEQAWNNLLFAHWPVARERLRERVPAFLELDAYDNEAWLTVSPFHLSDLRPRGVPALPWISELEEINLRTYVVYQGIPGVYFFSLDANSALAVGGARTVFHLPYFLADIRVRHEAGRVSFTSRRLSQPASFDAEYAAAGAAFEPDPGTIDYFLTERYCLYTEDSTRRAYRVEIQHRPWQLQPADAEIRLNTMAQAADITLPATAPRLHFARRQDVLTWRPRLLG